MSDILINMHDNLLPIYILGADKNKIQESVDRTDGYHNYQISICIDGEGIFTDEIGNTYKIKPGSLFFFSPNTPHKYESVSSSWKLPYIVFTGNSAAALKDYFGFRNSFVLTDIDADSFDKIHTFLNNIYDTYYSSIDNRAVRASALLYSMLIFISEIYHENSANVNDRLMCRLSPALNFIYYHMHEDISVDAIAEAVGISTGRLSVLFRQAFGTSPAQAVRKYRLNTAKRHLARNPSLKIKEIAAMCGFTSESYFVTAFRKEFGISPTDFKKNMPPEILW